MLPEDDYSTHWAVKDIDWCIEHEIMTGYPDGSFMPDKPVTRAEVAAIGRRICDYAAQNGQDIAAVLKQEDSAQKAEIVQMKAEMIEMRTDMETMRTRMEAMIRRMEGMV